MNAIVFPVFKLNDKVIEVKSCDLLTHFSELNRKYILFSLLFSMLESSIVMSPRVTDMPPKPMQGTWSLTCTRSNDRVACDTMTTIYTVSHTAYYRRA